MKTLTKRILLVTGLVLLQSCTSGSNTPRSRTLAVEFKNTGPKTALLDKTSGRLTITDTPRSSTGTGITAGGALGSSDGPPPKVVRIDGREWHSLPIKKPAYHQVQPADTFTFPVGEVATGRSKEDSRYAITTGIFVQKNERGDRDVIEMPRDWFAWDLWKIPAVKDGSRPLILGTVTWDGSSAKFKCAPRDRHNWPLE